MSLSKEEILKWVNGLSDDDSAGIDPDGLTLCSAKIPDAYLEIGGREIAIGDEVEATPLDGDFEEKFVGFVIGYRGKHYQVRDRDDNVFDCELSQLDRLN